jgi:pimeloyl-ACP methyl ester carboxylesterase
MKCDISHTVDDGIERIVYTPIKQKFQTPILMQHGMWHGAWCWQHWQEWLAEQGWMSISYSLPGHGSSPVRRPVRLCTLGYYYTFLKAEIERLPCLPILMAHSMGGALAQWYLKRRGELPAVVFVASWPYHSMWNASTNQIVQDPLSILLMALSSSSTPMVRNPKRAAEFLITEGALLTPEELHRKLGPDSILPVFQYRKPFWTPLKSVNTPMLWLGGEKDASLPEKDMRASAEYFNSEYIFVKDAGHNLMMECSYIETIQSINDWLLKTCDPKSADSDFEERMNKTRIV